MVLPWIYPSHWHKCTMLSLDLPDWLGLGDQGWSFSNIVWLEYVQYVWLYFVGVSQYPSSTLRRVANQWKLVSQTEGLMATSWTTSLHTMDSVFDELGEWKTKPNKHRVYLPGGNSVTNICFFWKGFQICHPSLEVCHCLLLAQVVGKNDEGFVFLSSGPDEVC